MEGGFLGFSVDVQQDFLMDGADGAVGLMAWGMIVACQTYMVLQT